MSIAKPTSRTIELKKVKVIVQGLLYALIILLPLMLHVQWITGPTVNGILFIATVMLGPTQALILGLIPSSIALGAGLLPLPLAPMVPFIMMSNVILVMVFNHLYKTNYFIAVGVSAFAKFIFLSLTVRWVMDKLLDGGLVSKLAVMMSWPQLYTALIGGVIAYTFLKSLKKI